MIAANLMAAQPDRALRAERRRARRRSSAPAWRSGCARSRATTCAPYGEPGLAVAVVDSLERRRRSRRSRERRPRRSSDALGEDAVDLGAGTLVRAARPARRDLVGGELYLVLDQFEEFFLYHGDEARSGDARRRAPRARDARATSGVNVLVCAARGRARAPRRLQGADSGALRELAAARPARPARRARRRSSARSTRTTRSRARTSASTIEPELVDAVLDQVAVGRIDHGRTGRGGPHVGGRPARASRRRTSSSSSSASGTPSASAGSRDAAPDDARASSAARSGSSSDHLEGALARLSDARTGSARPPRSTIWSRRPGRRSRTPRPISPATPGVAGARRMQALLATLRRGPHRAPARRRHAERRAAYEIYHDVLADRRARLARSATRRSALARKQRDDAPSSQTLVRVLGARSRRWRSSRRSRSTRVAQRNEAHRQAEGADSSACWRNGSPAGPRRKRARGVQPDARGAAGERRGRRVRAERAAAEAVGAARGGRSSRRRTQRRPSTDAEQQRVGAEQEREEAERQKGAADRRRRRRAAGADRRARAAVAEAEAERRRERQPRSATDERAAGCPRRKPAASAQSRRSEEGVPEGRERATALALVLSIRQQAVR